MDIWVLAIGSSTTQVIADSDFSANFGEMSKNNQWWSSFSLIRSAGSWM